MITIKLKSSDPKDMSVLQLEYDGIPSDDVLVSLNGQETSVPYWDLVHAMTAIASMRSNLYQNIRRLAGSGDDQDTPEQRE